MTNHLLALALAACLTIPVCARAQEVSEDQPAQALQAMQATLTSALATNPNDVDIMYRLGVVDYKLHDYQAALEMFERVLALNPRHAGAMLDMALTHYENGDDQEAEALFNRLAALPDLPPKVGEVLTAYQGKLALRRQSWRKEGSVALAYGHSSNANQGLNGWSVDLPILGNQLLAPSSMARSDNYTELSLDGHFERNVGARRLYVIGALRERRWESERDYDQRWLLGGGGMVTPLAPRVSLDSSVIAIDGWLGGRPLEQAGYWLNQLTYDRGAFAHWVRLEMDAQHFPLDSSYDAHQAKLVLGSGVVQAGWEVLGEMALTRDWATHERPGGDRHGAEWLLEGRRRLAPGWRLSAQWRYLREQQNNPFSPELFGPFVRADHGNVLNLALSWEQSQHGRWELSYTRSRLSSNLALYDLDRDEARLEWRYGWR